jgi:hypothetical protein
MNVFAVNLFNDDVSNRDEQRLTALENRMLRRSLGLKLYEAGKKCIIRSFITCTPCQKLEYPSQG